MQKEGRPHSGTLRALINKNLCSISCARRVGVMIFLLCISASGPTGFYSDRARSQARQLQAGRLSCSVLFFVVLNLNIFNQFNRLQI